MLLATALAAAPPGGDQVLPPALPGYELRSLDVRKPVVFDVNGAQVRILLPIFVYCPTGVERREAVRLLRQAYEDASSLGRKSDWTAADLQGILRALDMSLDLLERHP
jgi:hypothetical protein